MSSGIGRATIGLVAIVLLSACFGRDNLVDPEFSGSATIVGPDRIDSPDPVTYTVRVEPEQETPTPFLLSSSDSGILRMLPDGMATPVSAGTVTVRATYFGLGAEERDLVLEKRVVVAF